MQCDMHVIKCANCMRKMTCEMYLSTFGGSVLTEAQCDQSCRVEVVADQCMTAGKNAFCQNGMPGGGGHCWTSEWQKRKERILCPAKFERLVDSLCASNWPCCAPKQMSEWQCRSRGKEVSWSPYQKQGIYVRCSEPFKNFLDFIIPCPS